MSKGLLKPILYRLVTLMIGFCLALVAGEIVTAIYGYMHFSTFSVATLHQSQQENTFLRDIERMGNSYMATLFPHPYLAFVHRNGHGIEVNNVGLFGPDFPLQKDPRQFVILVTGGSVAAQFAQLKRDGIHYLEDILNTRYDFGGKQVLVLNGGDGAWRQPQQAILLLLYIDIVDAVITLDGFNEHYFFLGKGSRLGMPANNFHQVNPLAKHGYERLAAVWVSNRMRSFVASNRLLRGSHLAWFLQYGAGACLQRAATIHEDDRTTTIEGFFSLPDEWDKERCFQHNIEQYRKYIRMMNAMARSAERRAAFFLQPVPAIGKELTEDEKRVVGDLGYRDTYLRLTKELLALREEGIPVYDLLDVFSNTHETLYADCAHCIRYGAQNESKGYRLMAEAVAAVLEKEWGLERKPIPPEHEDMRENLRVHDDLLNKPDTAIE